MRCVGTVGDMGNEQNKEASGLSKTHKVRDAEGNEEEWTQQQWKDRDKNAGYTRVGGDDDGDDGDDDSQPRPEQLPS